MNGSETCERALLAEAKRQGCGQAETYYAARDAFFVDVQGGEPERYSVSRTCGIGLRVQVDGRDGYAYTERFDAPETLVCRAMDNARTIEDDDAHPMQGAQTYAEVAERQTALDGLDAAGRIALAQELERQTLAQDSRVQRVVACAVQTSGGEAALHNTLGLAAKRRTRAAYCYVEPLVEEDGEVQTGFAFRMGMAARDVAGCAMEAVADALGRLHGKPVPSGGYRVLLGGYAMADLLTAFASVFSAEQAQKGCSLLAQREGEDIAAGCVTLVDDPFDPVAPRAFDGEGTPCARKCIIENGRLMTLLHNLKTAAKAGCASTGNASRASAASGVDVAPSVLRLMPGQETNDALLSRLADGLVITELQGLHAGLSAVSGDFSLKAAGRRIENGVDTGAVGGVTLSGNFFTLLQDIEAVGSDSRFTMPGSFYCASPSVLIRKLQIAGE